VPGNGTVAARRYVYAPEGHLTDEKGFPAPVAEITLNLAREVVIDCPGHAIVMLTSMK
jgi:hypothetical protein